MPVAEIRPGDRIAVVPGERVPLDGTVLEGASEVDESLVTGEARPVAKAPGAAVIGGTVNRHGRARRGVTRVGKETVLAGIVRAVEEAQAAKPRIQAVADRVVGVFVPGDAPPRRGDARLLARARRAGRPALMTGISVVVIACPCALGLATPIAVIVSTGLATQRGLLAEGRRRGRAGRARDRRPARQDRHRSRAAGRCCGRSSPLDGGAREGRRAPRSPRRWSRGASTTSGGRSSRRRGRCRSPSRSRSRGSGR